MSLVLGEADRLTPGAARLRPPPTAIRRSATVDNSVVRSTSSGRCDLAGVYPELRTEPQTATLTPASTEPGVVPRNGQLEQPSVPCRDPHRFMSVSRSSPGHSHPSNDATTAVSLELEIPADGGHRRCGSSPSWCQSPISRARRVVPRSPSPPATRNGRDAGVTGVPGRVRRVAAQPADRCLDVGSAHSLHDRRAAWRTLARRRSCR